MSELTVRLIIVSEVGEYMGRENNEEAESVKGQRVNILDFTRHMISVQLSAQPG